MAIAPTGAIFNKLVFGSVDSSTYGIYITGEAVYNAPERAVELVSVAGRNGAIEIDQGRWENIEVTYPAGCFGASQSDFATAIRNFRNAVCSQIGYQRLTDTYNPNEYRMGLYMSGLDVTPASMNRAGQFDITFNCKPQRWLTSGETAVAVASGGKLTNPTLYNASPLLALEGYGTIGFNGHDIELESIVMGDVEVAHWENPSVPRSSYSKWTPINSALYNDADVLTWTPITLTQSLVAGAQVRSIDTLSLSLQPNTSPELVDNVAMVAIKVSDVEWRINFRLPAYSSTSGLTTSESRGLWVTITYTAKRASDGVSYSGTISTYVTQYYSHNSSTGKVNNVSIDCGNVYVTEYFAHQWSGIDLGTVSAFSSIDAPGHPTYIDCDLGECYKIEDGEVISLNRYIELGSDLPVLASGENEITYDNTFTSVKVTPRWWQL